TIRPTWSTVGQSPLNKDRTPARAQLSLVTPEHPLSLVFIEAVVSRMIITSSNFDLPPFAPAVAVAEMFTVPIPSTEPTNVETVACCVTTMPLANGDPEQVTPVLVKHLNVFVIVTPGRLALAFLDPASE